MLEYTGVGGCGGIVGGVIGGDIVDPEYGSGYGTLAPLTSPTRQHKNEKPIMVTLR